MDDKTEKLVISPIKEINEVMPDNYLKRNCLQYDFVSYISLVATLYLANNFNGAGMFIVRAYNSLDEVGTEKFDTEFLKRAIGFLNSIREDLINNNRVTSDAIKKMLKDKM